jgi:nicotinamide-nucleotide adenylyltransferase
MNKSVLIIGRFQPIHKGHISLIKRYANAGFFIKIGIGSSKNKIASYNPLNYSERKEIIKMAMKEIKLKKYKIYPIPDTSPKIDYLKHVVKIVGKFNTIITGNPAVLKIFLNYKKGKWNIESFEESNRPLKNITSGVIRTKWLIKSSRFGLLNSTFDYLRSINFTSRLKKLN